MTSKEKVKGGNSIHLCIEGEMTIYRASELKDVISPALSSNQNIEIDLSHVTELDSAGLQLMLSSKLESTVRGTKLSFSGHSPAVREVLDLCDLGGFFGDPVVMN